ncbi:unnamed protein product [Mortierella alpina]
MDIADLAFALDNLPRILETMSTAPSRPQSRPSSTSSSSSSSSPPSSPATGSSPSSALSSSPASTSSPSTASSVTSPSSVSTASKPTLQTLKGQLMLDLAKECHRSRSRSCSVACSAPSMFSQPRRISSSSQHHRQQSHQPHHSLGVSGTISGLTSTHYPLQFSTRAKAMAFLIEVLQSLQKEPCGCDLTKGCYCPGQDGIEDHEGKSPCYVCGEWFPDRRESGDAAPAQVQGGRAWHEQGSLRHHVAESRVKKWLDIVWRPPLKPATTPDQETAQHFGLDRSQEDPSQHPQQPPLVLSPHPGIWSQHPFDHQHQHQQNPPRMDPGRPWSVRDIESDARVKSRSRQNSFSSSSSASSSSTRASSPSASGPSSLSSRASSLSISNLQQHQDQDGANCRSGHGDGSDHPHGPLCTSSSAVDESAAQARSMDPSSTPTSARTPFPFDQHPWSSNSSDPLFDAPPFPHPTSRPARTRTQSCFDPQSGPGSAGSQASSFTPPISRPSSSNSNHQRRNKPTRAATTNSTFAIPQEILDPNYRSPTFRIKSWNPPASLTRQDLAAVGVRTLDGGRKEGTSPFTGLTTAEPESGGQSDATLDQHSSQQGAVTSAAAAAAAGAGAAMEPDRTDAVTTPAPSFRFNFTSERFKAAVQAATLVEKDGSVEVHPVLNQPILSKNASALSSPSSSSSSSETAADKPSMSSPVALVQKSAACIEFERVSTVVQMSEMGNIAEPIPSSTDDASAVADTCIDAQGRDAMATVVDIRSTVTDHPTSPLLSHLATAKNESDVVAATAATAATATAAAAADDDEASTAATHLAGMLSMSTPPRSVSSLSITADLIQKSAPMSPMSLVTPNRQQKPQQTIQGRPQDQACGTSGSTSSGSLVLVPTSPVNLSLESGSGSRSGSATATATATGAGHKAVGWRPLQRLMRKMTKSSNESVKPAMSRGGEYILRALDE